MASPADTYDRMVRAGAQKIMTPWRTQAVQGFMAGAYVSLGALFANLMEAAFKPDSTTPGWPPGLSNLVGGAVFPVGLIAIYLTGANLYTGNCMYVIPPLMRGTLSTDGYDWYPTARANIMGIRIAAQIRIRFRAFAYLVFSWLWNYAGAWFVVYVIAYVGKWTADGAVHDFVIANAEKKCRLEWDVAIVRGMGANWLVCLAWWQALSASDTFSKMAAVWLPVFTFTAIGFEHSVANMFYIQIGWLEGADINFTDILIHNLIPVSIGNFIGGAMFLGLAPYLSFDPDSGAQRPRAPTRRNPSGYRSRSNSISESEERPSRARGNRSGSGERSRDTARSVGPKSPLLQKASPGGRGGRSPSSSRVN